MKHDSSSLLQETRTTITDVVQWTQELERLHARIAPRFAQPEPRRRALAFLQGILSTTSRKNGWQLAEYAREARPDGMQRLLSSAVWDTDGVRDDLRSYVLSHLGTEQAVLAIDETSFPKRGTHSAGVGWQYCGTTGQVENCQVGVFLSYVTSRGHALIDRELYLPLDWCEDAERRQAAHIPEVVHFQTKPELARQMIERTRKAAVAFAWVVADTVYGGNFDLRNWLDEQGFHYVLAVACDEPVAFPSPRGHRREEAALVETVLPNQITWHRLSMSDGTKGPRLFDWALVPMLHRWEDDGCHGSRSSVGISPIFETSAITSCLLPWVHSFPRSSQRSAVVGILKRILSRRNRTWIAHRHIHGRNYKAVLGVTDHLTIACLEQAAAQLHAHLTAH